MKTLQRISRREVRCPSNCVHKCWSHSTNTGQLVLSLLIHLTLKVIAACMSCNGMSGMFVNTLFARELQLQYLLNLLVFIFDMLHYLYMNIWFSMWCWQHASILTGLLHVLSHMTLLLVCICYLSRSLSLTYCTNVFRIVCVCPYMCMHVSM